MTENMSETLERLEESLNTERNRAEYFKESYDDAVRSMLALENVGWNQLTGYNTANEGMELEQIKSVRRQLQEWTDTNPLLWNGLAARCSYIFGNGYKITTVSNSGTVSTRVQTLIEKEQNQEVLFSEEALRVNERERYTGVLLVKFDKSKQEFSRLNVDEIEQVIIDPDNPERIWYYYRHYTRDVVDFSTGQITPKEVMVWYRTDKADLYKAPKPATINGVKVDQNVVVVDDVVNRKAGNTFGIPDAFPAAPWALAYSAYLRDGTKVLASLAEWAWQYRPKSKNAGTNAGAAIRSNDDGAGQIAVADGDLVPLPRSSAVDLNTGRPIAAQVAASLGISVLAILMDPGSGGSFGAAATLSDPGLRVMKARQNVNSSFLCRCLTLLGLKGGRIIWAKIDTDSDLREQQAFSGALGTGLFHADEIREPLAEVLHIELTHDSAPDGYLVPNNSNSEQLNTIDPATAPANQSTVTPDGSQPQLPNGSPVKPDGTTALTNGQGKPANTAKPSYGVNDLRNSGGR